MKSIEQKHETKFLRKELERQIEKNQNYSMRAFAKSLNFHVGSLSALINSKRPLTVKTAKMLFQRLGLSPTEQKLRLERSGRVIRYDEPSKEF